jgi:hypothetical protein
MQYKQTPEPSNSADMDVNGINNALDLDEL